MPAEPSTDAPNQFERHLRTAGFLLGPALALAVYAWNPGGHPPEARRLLAIVTLTVVWWMTEALPLAATAVLSSAFAVATGVAPVRQVLAPYADPVIFLFLGSFFLAEAFRKYGLDRRVARAILSVRAFARSPRGLVAGFGVASATVSSFLSNTATAALFTPVATGTLDARAGRSEGAPRRLDTAVLLAVAYGASIGGLATIIGTPPNLLVAGFLERMAGVRVTFTGWLLFGLPLSALILVVAIVGLSLRLGLRHLTLDTPAEVADAPAGGSAERAGRRWTVAAILLAFALWTMPAVAGAILGRAHPLAQALDRHFPEAGVALLCGALLFAVPASWRERRFVLAWKDAEGISWDILLLFGGGLSLGTLAETTGLAKWVGEGVVRSGLAASPEGLLLVSIAAALAVTEVASNTAAATLLIPIVIAASREAGFDPVPPAIGAGVACTCAFVFPVSTPPNAIVFGTGRVPLTRMIRVGVLLDLACLLVLWAGIMLLRPLLPHAG
jgi:solute carrier family 13 (sodium-dependent dicarboxylate transporter), member 2/3/5